MEQDFAQKCVLTAKARGKNEGGRMINDSHFVLDPLSRQASPSFTYVFPLFLNFRIAHF